jgi:hypothetical protein
MEHVPRASQGDGDTHAEQTHTRRPAKSAMCASFDEILQEPVHEHWRNLVQDRDEQHDPRIDAVTLPAPPSGTAVGNSLQRRAGCLPRVLQLMLDPWILGNLSLSCPSPENSRTTCYSLDGPRQRQHGGRSRGHVDHSVLIGDRATSINTKPDTRLGETTAVFC